MSLAQIGENSVCLIVGNDKYLVRELEIPNEVLVDSTANAYQLVHSWKIQSLSIKNISAMPSKLFKGRYFMNLMVNGQIYEIHFYIEPITGGLKKDKRLRALAVINLG